MKIKSDFITNSSSSSFLVLTKEHVKESDVKNVIAKLCGTSELLPFLSRVIADAFAREMQATNINDVMVERYCHTIDELKEEYSEYEDVEEYPVIYEGSFSNDDGSVGELLCDSDINYRDENIIIRKEGGF
jgi:hypothetical protein